MQTSCKITKSDILSMYCISSVFENYLSSSEKFSSSVGKFALKNRALDAPKWGQICLNSHLKLQLYKIQSTHV